MAGMNVIEQLGGRNFDHLSTVERCKGKWQYLYAITDTVIAYLDGNYANLGTSTLVGKTLVAGELLVGMFTQIQLTSGEVALYPEKDGEGAVAHHLTYDGNGLTSGTAPVNALHYAPGETVTVAEDGDILRTNYKFIGWNTAANGTGTAYAEGATLTFGTADIVLYAQWELHHHVTYDGNTNTGGTAPTDATLYYLGDVVTTALNTGTLVKTGYILLGWNTAANGTGTHYALGATLVFAGASLTLYAEWETHHHVTYDGNTNTGGTVPTDAVEYYKGDTVTAKTNSGTLVKTNYSFRGWNTAADGSGTHIAVSGTFTFAGAALTLYAEWEAHKHVTYDGNGNDGGAVPSDATAYYKEDYATVAGNSGALTLAGYKHKGWNTAANYTGVHYDHGQTILMTAAVTLYAEWVAG